VPILYVLIVNAGLKSDGKDWAIASGSKRVQEAINHYIEKHGSPPQKLENLIPEFIDSIPIIPEISRVDYRLSPDGEGWTLDLYRTAIKNPLIYRRTNIGLGSEDAKRRIDTYDGCYILKTRS
jgi:hypothetical protein